MGSEVSDRTVLQDEHLLRAAERNHSMCDRIGTQHVLHDQSLHLRGEFVEYTRWGGPLHGGLPPWVYSSKITSTN